MVAKITSFEVLSDDVVMTDAYDGCYISRADFDERQYIGHGGMVRMYDHDDDSVSEHGPLWQYASREVASEMEQHFYPSRFS